MSTRPFISFLLAALMALVPVGTVPATPDQAAAGPPQVIVAVLAPNALIVTDIKFRVFYNKSEVKHIPLQDYDFDANLTDELLAALGEDKRAAWRAATPAEEEAFAPYFQPKVKTEQVRLPETIRADRLLLVQAGCDGFLHSTQKWVRVSATARLVDRPSGRTLWKKSVGKRSGLPAPLEELQLENQKALKELLNKLMEQVVAEIKAESVKKKV